MCAFFVVSGFLMVYAHGGDFGRPGATKKFYSRRIARIVPLYVGTSVRLNSGRSPVRSRPGHRSEPLPAFVVRSGGGAPAPEIRDFDFANSNPRGGA